MLMIRQRCRCLRYFDYYDYAVILRIIFIFAMPPPRHFDAAADAIEITFAYDAIYLRLLMLHNEHSYLR